MMSTEQREDPQAAAAEQRHTPVNPVIGEHVILAPGKPVDLHRVQVCPLWGDHYRVNVFVGVDAVSL
jgi:hypothetical protein